MRYRGSELFKCCSLLGPVTPVRWVHVDLDFGFCTYPIIFNPAAGKDERMKTVLIDDSQMDMPISGH